MNKLSKYKTWVQHGFPRLLALWCIMGGLSDNIYFSTNVVCQQLEMAVARRPFLNVHLQNKHFCTKVSMKNIFSSKTFCPGNEFAPLDIGWLDPRGESRDILSLGSLGHIVTRTSGTYCHSDLWEILSLGSLGNIVTRISGTYCHSDLWEILSLGSLENIVTQISGEYCHSDLWGILSLGSLGHIVTRISGKYCHSDL